MNIKVLGSVCIIIGCAGYGFSAAAAYRKEVRMLTQLLGILDEIRWELQYRLTPIPLLMGQAAESATGKLKAVFNDFVAEIDNQICPDLSACMHCTLSKIKGISPISGNVLMELGRSIGKFDLSGQLESLARVRNGCAQELAFLNSKKDERIRNYQTLGLCAGSAIVIMLL